MPCAQFQDSSGATGTLPKLGTVIGFDALNGDVEARGIRRLIDGGELVEPAGGQLEVLDVHLDGLAWNLDFVAAPTHRSGALHRDW